MQAFKHAMVGIFDYQGRSTRSQYWYFCLQSFLIAFVIAFVGSLLLGTNSPVLHAINGVYTLIMFVAGISIGVRRLHDSNHSGWWLLIPILSVVFLCFASTPGQNRFGCPVQQ